jgi:hypothetical protein
VAKYKTQQKIYWQWMGRSIEGIIIEVHESPVVKEIKGKLIKRNGSTEKPAYFVQSTAGNFALKLESELTALNPKIKLNF